MTTQALRYHLPKKAIKSDCPDCGPKHRKTLSRYLDTRIGEPLPEIYGRCDRESNCGYHLSPYHKTHTGLSYAEQVYQQWLADNQQVSPGLPVPIRIKPSSSPVPITPVIPIPDEVFTASLGHYERNQFARLLQVHFGMGVADELLARFAIGTSSYWPGACVFWLKDERQRVRGGQVVLFEPSGHTAKRTLTDGSQKRCTGWVHYALASRYGQKQLPRPEWLTTYIEQADKFPVSFGLSQLLTAPTDQPVAIVEAPKTAVICTPYFPQFIWMAIGGSSYLNAERLAPLRRRKIILFPDLNAYHDRLSDKGQVIKGWLSRAQELQTEGFNLTASDYLEQRATETEKADGLDLADYLLNQWNGYPPDWD
jgi:hypothetical protein